MDKASPHYKSKKYKKYFEKNKDTLIPVSSNRITGVYGYGRDMEYSQTRSTCPKILSIIFRFKNKISKYFRTKRFNLNMRNYLLRDEFREHMLIGIYILFIRYI